jgi:dTDP-4-dehydrorhamnose reductase
LCRQLGDAAIPLDLPEFDLTDAPRMQQTLADLRPEAIINCAAYTAVDQAEQDADQCRAVNATSVAHLARAAEGLQCPLVQISTDYVFAGSRERRSPYTESDLPAPQGVYAQSKHQGENFASQWQRHYIVRTCGLYGTSARANNFVETMLRLGRQRPVLKVVDDQQCTPSYTVHVALAVLLLLQLPAPFGIYHVVNGGRTTWFGFAQEIFRQAKIKTQVEPITTEQYGAAAPRPRYSVLDTTKYSNLGAPPLPSWQQALAEYLMARG